MMPVPRATRPPHALLLRPRPLAALSAAVLAAAALALPAAARAQDSTSRPVFPQIRIGGRLHVQAYAVDNADAVAAGALNGPPSSFFIRRARIEASGRIAEHVSFVVQPSFENAAGREPNLRLRDAYIDVRLAPAGAAAGVTLRVGQSKRPFSRWELTSSSALPTIERGAGRGLVGLAPNNLFERNGFLSHDLGASVIVAAPRATLQAGIYNGQGESFNDVNAAKSYGVRATVSPLPRLSLGAAFFSHDAIVTLASGAPDSSFRNAAFGVDAEWGGAGDPGLFVLAEYLAGRDESADEVPIRGLTAVAAWHHRLGGDSPWLWAIEPALRFDAADPNADVGGDRATLAGAALGLYLSSKAQLRIGYERQAFEDDAIEAIHGIRTMMTVGF